ncbi:MAG TPA: hypothetical protein PLQ93_09370 [Bacteroidia bacterium]|nr:hypothetical protein [Bacteroidia bacterium]
MKQLTIISLLFILVSCKQQPEKSTTLDISDFSHEQDSVLTIKRNSKDNNYIQITFYSDWYIKTLTEFKNGQKNGKDIFWRPNQNMLVERYFDNNKMNRTVREVYRNGRTAFEGERINGEFEGVVNSFYKSGAIEKRWTRQNGQDLGLVIYYHENGQVKEIGENTSTGYKKTNEWDENGQKIFKIQ